MGEQVLTVVEDQQQRLGAQIVEQLLAGVFPLSEGEADGLADGGHDAIRRLHAASATK